jgi:glycosyltransferase involved in cell wall biosynthesis
VSKWAAFLLRLPWLAIEKLIRSFLQKNAPVVGVSMAGYHPEIGGVGNYAISLLKAWPIAFPFLPLRVFCTKQNFAFVQKLPFVSRIHHRYLQAPADILSHSSGCDIVFYPCASLDVVPPPSGTVFHLADLQEWFFPEYFSEEELCRRRNRYRSLLAYAAGIFVPSDFSRKCVIELLGFDEERVFTVPVLSADLPHLGARPANLEFADYLFFPADDYSHKNHQRLVEALLVLKSKGYSITLVCTGSRVSDGSWLGDAKQKGLKIQHLGRVSREEIRWLYDNARALVFPSQFEGFGIPVLEAFRCGTPVVCSHFSSLPEVAGNAAIFFDPFDTEDMARALREVFDAHRCSELKVLGYKQAEKYCSKKLIQRHADAFAMIKKRLSASAKTPKNVRLPEIDSKKAWSLSGREKPRDRGLAVKPDTPFSGFVSHSAEKLPVHFFTIVLNGMPFLEMQLVNFSSMNVDWRWHIVEGLAELRHDTAWSLQNGGYCPDRFHKHGLSVDGTTEFLDEMARAHPGRVSLYRKQGPWDGKTEMCNAPLDSMPSEALLWQVDVDEFWSPQTIEEVHRCFLNNSQIQAAKFACRFFVSPDCVLDNIGFYGNNPACEWRRVWRFKPGDHWVTHEPPVLARNHVDLFDVKHLSMHETRANGWIFDHLAYVSENQVAFKQDYYGYQGAVEGWKKLRQSPEDEIIPGLYLPWIPTNVWAKRSDSLPFRL